MKNIHKITLVATVAAVAAGALVASSLGSGTTAIAASATAGSLSDAAVEELWRTECASCHGRDGAGQTRAGRRAGVEDFTEHQNQMKFSNERAFKSIKAGLTENGQEQMKPYGKAFSDENGLSDEEIVALIHYTRAFGPEEWTEELNKTALEADEKKAELEEFIREHGPEAWK